MPALPNILVVDDSRSFLQILIQYLEQSIKARIFSAGSLEEARLLLEEHTFDEAILDLNLPDAPEGQIVDMVLAYDIPVIVFAGDCSDQTRKRLWSKNIVDYIVKEGQESLRYAVSQARRILLNRDIKALVVDDSNMIRTMIVGLLRVHRFQVFEAPNGRAALQVLAANPDLRLIITDHEMPEMDGATFVRTVRQRYPKESLAIIGISSHEQEFLSTRFLKSGANDFLPKPFSSEEFYCRVSQNVDLMEYIQTIRNYAWKDFLTGLYNRRYLFEQGSDFIKQVRRSKGHLCVAMLDIDHFKKVNDQFGHEVGDAVLQALGATLQSKFASKSIAARLGGEEFCLLFQAPAEDAPLMMDTFRKEIEAQPVHQDDQTVHYTLSIGLYPNSDADLETSIRRADALLYRAKQNGRNRLEVWTEHDDLEPNPHPVVRNARR